ncbi:hypothetical protein [Methylobacterium indicum]|uniref:Uncharacterized protein n=1 Tax=Methylobacterium indicum TaxID=1775910 RepID=A0ABR5H7R5_9HYPH|nr:hypothetical protein [Methylobacterium indicum]KMO20221.1 hypothetical protein QR78_11065 [Methylobacterium indicum]KMO20538.1 hypothetical protein QR79_18060 [Methylobacterium indicum]
MIGRMDDAITTVFAPLIGLPCWGVERGQGSILSFEFGSPRLFAREPYVSTASSAKLRRSAAQRVVKPVGEWNLFVFCCHWRIVTSGEIPADDDSTSAGIEAAAQAMDGQRLTAFALDAASRQAAFSFDLGARLTTWPYETNDDEQWSLYMPGERVLTYHADGLASLGATDVRLEQEIWQAVARDVMISKEQR